MPGSVACCVQGRCALNHTLTGGSLRLKTFKRRDTNAYNPSPSVGQTLANFEASRVDSPAPESNLALHGPTLIPPQGQ